MSAKNVLVLARNDNEEAMRVAAGLTISGHIISLIFMGDVISKNDLSVEKVELLELSEILPKTTNIEMEELLKRFCEIENSEKIAATLQMFEVIEKPVHTTCQKLLLSSSDSF